MYSKIKLFGHPIHSVLVAFPLALYTISFLGFFAYAVNPTIFTYKAALYCTYAGIFSAIVAAIPGTLDWWLGIPKNTTARQRGFLHATLNISALVLFFANAAWLWGTSNSPVFSVAAPIILTGIGTFLTWVGGYHGAALVLRHKVGVHLSPEQERLETQEELKKSA